MSEPTPTVTVIRRPSDPARRARFIRLLSLIVDKHAPPDPR